MHDPTPEAAPPSSSAQPPEAATLTRFLAADPAERARLAPAVAEAVGASRMEEIVEATLARTGTPVTVTDSPDGLIVTGPRGSVRAWARQTPDGQEITGLLLEGAPYAPPARRSPLRTPVVWLTYVLVLALWNVFTLWTAADRTSWCAGAATLAAFFVFAEGYGAPAQHARARRRTAEAAALTALASAYRLPTLPTGHFSVALGTALALLAGAVCLLAAARLHHWRTPVSQPLLFPLEGTWYVIQGGGRPLNHHVKVPEQRAALDLVGLGPHGTRTRPDRDLTAYAAYGRPVRSPCHGRVISAATTIPDQRPGEIRYQPLYGNHVFLDTGREIIKLAHLRPGSVTVKPGDVVEPGELLGEVGNSGNSSEPHLHLHAERDGLGLDLRFTDVRGRLYRGRRIRV
ncbi:M23 family metallopeptidase [Streptomyces sp. Ag109_G2-15]|uniref:M23 family metallopeptidase n=1 Tax=Streptomyces sp. Ag109_G2-15 TaxID=1938850 RepID=UPI000BDB334E|nr:M23 family metallopeptidase [Streptomyces sp. Ag109_G2-15]SOD85850.1 Peptidase family M23 [Streptomyces sp. Ag109_G2-15]